MIEMSHETEALAKARAAEVGQSPEDVVRKAVLREGRRLPWRNLAKARPSVATKMDLVAALEEIAARSASRPKADPRSADEIMGYDDFGLPR